MRKVCQIGICDIKTRTSGKVDKSYLLWSTMIRRCYSEKLQEKYPTYKDCSVSNEWLIYSNFKKDVESMKGFNVNGFELDKDLLFKGNKVYSKETCCFVPKEINYLMINGNKSTGYLPIGVYLSTNKKNPYASQCRVSGKNIHLGYFDCIEKAFNCYKEFKEQNIKRLANYYKENIDSKLYDSLMNWKIEKFK